jgi:hypothetical protein
MTRQSSGIRAKENAKKNAQEKCAKEMSKRNAQEKAALALAAARQG